MKKKNRLISALMKFAVLFLVAFIITAYNTSDVMATDITPETPAETTADSSDNFTIGITAGNGSDLASVLQILLVLTVIALAPSILIMLTSFTRIIIVMHFTRTALGTQTAPPNQVLDIAQVEEVETMEDIPIYVLIPSFIVSELRTAFIIGFLIYIPFIIIDMVVASALMSMGMMMLPPTTISLPFKILLFVMADGWNLIIGNLVKTFY